MKIYLDYRLLLLYLCCSFTFTFSSSAQSVADSVFSINNTVFKCEKSNGILYIENAQSVDLNELQYCKRVTEITSPSLSHLLVTVFSKERLDELKGNNLVLRLWVDRQQVVRKVKFRFLGAMSISNEELYLLEIGLKQQVKISYNTEKDCLYALIYKAVRFDKLLEESKASEVASTSKPH